MLRTILHIDFDSFFASCEQQFNPSLRGKPIGITAHNGRTAIIAASREAKKRGVKSPSRTFDALQICPEIIFTTSHFTKYWEISQQFVDICKDYSPFVELFSLDEVFIDITKTSHLFGGIENVLEHIKKRIKEKIGEYITVSIGISYNKLLAKLASGLEKPSGITTITPENLDTVYAKAKLTDICGIGERIKIRLNNLGIYTLLQLRLTPLQRLITEFGKVEAQFLYSVGLGIDTSPIIPYTDVPEVKSIGRNYCLPQNEYRERVVLQNIYELCEEVGIKLRRLNKKAKTVGISLRGNISIEGRKTYIDYVDIGSDIFKKCMHISHIQLNRGYLLKSTEYIRQISIWVSNLEDAKYLRLELFSNTLKKQKLVQVIDSVNKKFGDHTIRNGFLLYADKLTTEPNGFLADRYARTKLALTPLE